MISEQHAREYCSEDISLIQNYSEAIADTTQTWVCHHRAEILPCGRYSRAQLKGQGLLKHVPASQLIFLTRKEHRRLHMQGNTYQLGKHLSAKAKAKISKAFKGKPSRHKGKLHSEEAKAKIAAAVKRRWQKWREEHGCI